MGAMVGSSAEACSETFITLPEGGGAAPKTSPELKVSPGGASPELPVSKSAAEAGWLMSMGWLMPAVLASGASGAPQEAGPEMVPWNLGGAALALDSELVSKQPPSGQKVKCSQAGVAAQRCWHCFGPFSLVRVLPGIL
mmetsp:Transcript_40990/g.76207  ORF Transcript_40990/g.76207 Transcript_40990/m.76207 type:complete len:139 (-) Transcript_40990:275-691(-)